MNVDKEIDCSGLFCPLPVVHTKLAIEELNKGDILKVVADDPGSKEDLPAWCDETGNKLLKTEEEDDIYIFYIEKKED